MNIQNAKLNLNFKLFQYNGTSEDQDFLEQQFHVTSSDYDIDWNDKNQKVKPRITTLNEDRIFLEKDDYLLYADDPLTNQILGDPYPIILASNDWDFNDILNVENLINNHTLKIKKWFYDNRLSRYAKL